MSAVPYLESPAPRGLFGLLRAWARARSSALREPFEVVPQAVGEHDARFDGSVCVLVVDDNPVNLMLMSTLIESRGLVVFLAADGAEAVALACELHFDFILMDLQMPVLDGYGATREIRRFESSSSRSAVPVIAYSSATPHASVLAAHGINGSLSKPCGDQELEDCLRKWCPAYRPHVAVRAAAHDNGRAQRGHRSGAAPAEPTP